MLNAITQVSKPKKTNLKKVGKISEYDDGDDEKERVKVHPKERALKEVDEID